MTYKTSDITTELKLQIAREYLNSLIADPIDFPLSVAYTAYEDYKKYLLQTQETQ